MEKIEEKMWGQKKRKCKNEWIEAVSLCWYEAHEHQLRNEVSKLHWIECTTKRIDISNTKKRKRRV